MQSNEGLADGQAQPTSPGSGGWTRSSAGRRRSPRPPGVSQSTQQTQTALRHDVPHRLGVFKCGLPSDMMALITSVSAAGKGRRASSRSPRCSPGSAVSAWVRGPKLQFGTPAAAAAACDWCPVFAAWTVRRAGAAGRAVRDGLRDQQAGDEDVPGGSRSPCGECGLPSDTMALITSLFFSNVDCPPTWWP